MLIFSTVKVLTKQFTLFYWLSEMVFVLVLSLFCWIMTSSAFGSAFDSAFGLVFCSVFGSFEGSVGALVVASLAVALVVVVPSIDSPMVGKFYFSSIMLSITEVSVVILAFKFVF